MKLWKYTLLLTKIVKFERPKNNNFPIIEGNNYSTNRSPGSHLSPYQSFERLMQVQMDQITFANLIINAC